MSVTDCEPVHSRSTVFRRRRILISMIVVAAVVVSGAAWWLSRRGPEEPEVPATVCNGLSTAEIERVVGHLRHLLGLGVVGDLDLLDLHAGAGQGVGGLALHPVDERLAHEALQGVRVGLVARGQSDPHGDGGGRGGRDHQRGGTPVPQLRGGQDAVELGAQPGDGNAPVELEGGLAALRATPRLSVS